MCRARARARQERCSWFVPHIWCDASTRNGCNWVCNWVMIQTRSIRSTPVVLSAIAEIDEFKRAWRALGRLALERLSALGRVATIESIGSSTQIERSKLSDREVQRLLTNLEIKTFATRDEQEVSAYAQVRQSGVGTVA